MRKFPYGHKQTARFVVKLTLCWLRGPHDTTMPQGRVFAVSENSEHRVLVKLASEDKERGSSIEVTGTEGVELSIKLVWGINPKMRASGHLFLFSLSGQF